MQRHQRDRARFGIVLVEVGDERDRFEERLHAREPVGCVGRVVGARADADPADRDEPAEVAALDLLVELARRADELLQVLDAALRLDRPLRLELGEVAAARQHRFERGADTARRGVASTSSISSSRSRSPPSALPVTPAAAAARDRGRGT